MTRRVNRPGRCHTRVTEADFAPYPVGARVSVAWGSSGRMKGVVVGRTPQRLRVLLDPPFSHRRHRLKGPSGEETVWDTSPSPLTVKPE